MSDPKRLIEVGSPRLRALLEAQPEEVPPDVTGGKRRTLATLGLTSAPVAPSPKRRWPFLASAALVAACAAVVALSRDGHIGATNRPASTITSTAQPASPISQSAPSITNEPRADEAQESAAPAAPSAASAKPPSNPLPRPPAASGKSALGDDLSALERAQSALAREQPNEALALVRAYRRDYPAGRFGAEIDVIEIEALAKSGATAEASNKAARFLAKHPGSPYATRIEGVIGGDQ